MIRIFSALLCTVLLLAGCAPGFPTCVREHARQQVVRWGEIRNNVTTGYQVTAQAGLFALSQTAPSAPYELQTRGRVDEMLYCERLDMVRRAFIDVQALNVPGEVRRFVEFSNPANDVEMRAVWNPEYETKGNARFRAVYDSLETMRLSAQ